MSEWIIQYSNLRCKGILPSFSCPNEDLQQEKDQQQSYCTSRRIQEHVRHLGTSARRKDLYAFVQEGRRHREQEPIAPAEKGYPARNRHPASQLRRQRGNIGTHQKAKHCIFREMRQFSHDMICQIALSKKKLQKGPEDVPDDAALLR